MPKSVTLQSGCKINLFLRIGNKLANGYHDLETIFLPLTEPHDTLTITSKTDAPVAGLTVSFDTAIAPTDDTAISPTENTLTKAYDWYAQETKFAPPLHVTVTKRIPHGAGLGGGSANAATLLLYLQEEARKKGYSSLPEKALLAGAAKIGADVPFFLINKPAHATGVGEKLTIIEKPFSGWYLVLVCPEIKIATAWAFKELDALRQKSSFFETNSLTFSGAQTITSFVRMEHLKNDFEEVVFHKVPELPQLCKKLLDSGAEVAHMSGTGASIFGIFEDEKDARKAVKTLAKIKASIYIQQM